MTRTCYIILILFIIYLAFHVGRAYGDPWQDCATTYCTIYYTDTKDLMRFEKRVGDIDSLASRVLEITGLRYKEVPKAQIYLQHENCYIAFGITAPAAYYPKEKLIRANIDYVKKHHIAHELTHFYVCQYFLMYMPGQMQEVVAQWVEGKT